MIPALQPYPILLLTHEGEDSQALLPADGAATVYHSGTRLLWLLRQADHKAASEYQWETW